MMVLLVVVVSVVVAVGLYDSPHGQYDDFVSGCDKMERDIDNDNINKLEIL